ncbi:hypothetical protein HDU67_003089 [Dinochytrium kinnereticum]|nr:hypothetical protein HDU67_003089 [Dinochytrium kinnereticum]
MSSTQDDEDASRRTATTLEASQAPLSTPVILNILKDSLPSQTASPSLRSPADLTFATLHSVMGKPKGRNLANFLTPGMRRKMCMRFGMKIADRLVIHCLAIEDNRLQTIELTLPTIISSSATFPLSPTATTLPTLFASSNALVHLIFQFKKDIVDKVAPNLGKEGYEPATSSSSSSLRDESRGRRFRDYDEGGGLIDPSFVPPPRGGGPASFFPGRSPYGIGDVDLDPFAAAPGIIPPRGGMHPGGGMIVGPDHPMFGGGGGGYGGGFTGPGRYPGGGSFLPPGAVPPGARFDPIGPFGPRPGGFGGGVGPMGPGRGGFEGGPLGPRAGGPRQPPRRMGPDNDELPPPGYDNMFL